MATKTEFRLSMAPLRRTIYAGRGVQKNGQFVPVGVRHDVTSDFYDCIIRYAASYNGAFEIIGIDGVWDVSVKKRPDFTDSAL